MERLLFRFVLGPYSSGETAHGGGLRIPGPPPTNAVGATLPRRSDPELASEAWHQASLRSYLEWTAGETIRRLALYIHSNRRYCVGNRL